MPDQDVKYVGMSLVDAMQNMAAEASTGKTADGTEIAPHLRAAFAEFVKAAVRPDMPPVFYVYCYTEGCFVKTGV